jgi:hypothetical protein
LIFVFRLEAASILSKFTFTHEILELLAALNHQLYCEAMTARGFKYGPVRDDTLHTRPLLTDYANLPEEAKQNNREAVQNITENLHAVGCTLSSAPADEYSLMPADIEVMAKLEHRRYVENAIHYGWRYGPQFDADKKLNPTLVPWEALNPSQLQEEFPDLYTKLGPGPLPEAERQKDREPVSYYPILLKRAGLVIVKVHD